MKARKQSSKEYFRMTGMQQRETGQDCSRTMEGQGE